MGAVLPPDPLTERRDMRSRNERGEGQASTLVLLAIVIAAGFAAWNVAPVYMDHYSLVDKVNEICRTPRYRAPTDERISELLMKEVRERRMDQWIGPKSFRISTTDTSRRILLNYERETQILPGWKKLFKFDFQADQPLV
jgi:hypothetical protein